MYKREGLQEENNRVTHHIKSALEKEIHFDFTRSSGPGGQNVNKVATAVQLRFHILDSPSLPDEVKERLLKLAGTRITSDGELIIQARRQRSQQKNRQDALAKFHRLVQKAMSIPKIRRPTKPTRTANLKRLESKRRRGETKRLRQKDTSDL